MNDAKFKAFFVEQDGENFKRNIISKQISDLPEGDITINVKYSSLNYKDALSSIGNKGVTRNYPHTPGIDAAGIVVGSNDNNIKEGDKVLVTGYDLGMNTDGGFEEYIRVPSKWVVKLPENLSLKESMIYGTAGFTAAISVYKLMKLGRVKPEDGEILVTGATGGVGSTAIKILSKLGYDVIGATGKKEEKDMIVNMGAKDIINRHEFEDESGKPILKSRWAGVIDTTGGNILSTAIKTTNYGGSVTTCGNVAGHKFDASVYPFILRGVSLLGVDSVNVDNELRNILWSLLSNDWKIDTLHDNINEIGLSNLNDEIHKMLNGSHKGRTIVNLEI